MTSHKVKLTNPQAAVIVWNYDHRLNLSGGVSIDDPHNEAAPINAQKLDEIIILTASLKSIKTSKQKSRPAGTFELRLAPTYNWVTRLTPGSWCTILMTQNESIPPLHPAAPMFASEKRDKMFGKILSVRANVVVDQNGARHTEYIVTGKDWGYIFDQKMYIDETVAKAITDKSSPIGAALQIYWTAIIDNYIANSGLPTSHEAMKLMVRLWGAPLKELADGDFGKQAGILAATSKIFELPFAAILYFKFLEENTSAPSNSFADLLHTDKKSGILTGDDTYKVVDDSRGITPFESIKGMHTLWQLCLDNCNIALNELVVDLTWDNEFKAAPTIKKRIRPFVNRTSFPGSGDVEDLISPFKYVKKTLIPEEQVISINYGTNADDRFNFVEVLPNVSKLKFLDTQAKSDAQVYDTNSISRDGFKPKIERTRWLDYDGSEPAPIATAKWKHLIKEWHFNSHVMLNGAVTFIGQDCYIAVGDNIQMPVSVLGEPNMNKKLADNAQNTTEIYFTAHVENISHSFTVDGNGARSFNTTVQFVRGVITDKDGKVINDEEDSIAIDTTGTRQNGRERQKNRKVLGTSTDRDPDQRKLKGT